jgi:hypothetical protein
MGNNVGWDTTNTHFWLNYGGQQARGINWFYDMDLDITYTAFCSNQNHSTDCIDYSA